MDSPDDAHRFLVSIEIARPSSLPDDEWDGLLAREGARGRELVDHGRIRGIWRVVGQTSNVGIWVAPSHEELHMALSSLPLFRYMTIKVDALCSHPLGEFTPGPTDS